MKNFIFYQKNSSAVMALSAPTYDDAYEQLTEELGGNTWGWRCDDQDGEDQ